MFELCIFFPSFENERRESEYRGQDDFDCSLLMPQVLDFLVDRLNALESLCTSSGPGGGSREAGLSKFQNNKNKCIFNKCTIKVGVNCSFWRSGTYASGMPIQTVSLTLCSFRSNVRVKGP